MASFAMLDITKWSIEMTTTKGPWRVLGSTIKYKNPWISVREDKVVRPDGKPGIYGVVTMLAGVSVLALDENNNVYLTKEYHYGVERDTLEVISGGIDKNETKLAAAQRELKEEAGIEASRWTDLGVLDPFTAVVSSPQYLYLAEGLTQGSQAMEGTEKIEIIKMSLKEAIQQVMESKITHGGSVAVILKAAHTLSESKS